MYDGGRSSGQERKANLRDGPGGRACNRCLRRDVFSTGRWYHRLPAAYPGGCKAGGRRTLGVGRLGVDVLLVYPDYTVVESLVRRGKYHVEEGGWYSEGLAALAARLKEAGHRPWLLHLTRPAEEEEFVSAVRSRDPAVVAITVRSSALSDCALYTAWARAASPALVVWGGYHPTIAPEECMAVPGVDGVCLGEGDDALVELADALSGKGDAFAVRSMWFNTPRGQVRNEVRPLVEDLDELPLPDFDLFDPSRLLAARAGAATAIVSRGCVFRCGYCCNHRQRAIYPNAARYARYRSPRGAIAYPKRLTAWYPGVREIRFLDNVFGLRRQWLEEFADLYRREVGLPFACNQRPDLVDRDLARLLAEAGCRMVYMGIETGDPGIRGAVLGRPVRDERILEAFRVCRDFGMETVAYNMVGLPGEDREKALATVKLNARCPASRVVVSVFSPYPGTDLYEISMRERFVRPPLDYRARAFLDQPGLSKAEVLFFHLWFRPLFRAYRLLGSDTSLGRLADRVVLSRHLPVGLLVLLAEVAQLGVVRLRHLLQVRLPRLYRLLRAWRRRIT